MGGLVKIPQSFVHDPCPTISGKKTSRISSNSEAFASELLENLEENGSALLHAQ